MTEQFTSEEIESPRLIAEMLLSHVLGGQRIDLYADANRITTDEERATLRALVLRTMKHEPVQYIVGDSSFKCIKLAPTKYPFTPAISNPIPTDNQTIPLNSK